MRNESTADEAGMDGDSGRQSALAMDAATFRALGHRLVDRVTDFLDAPPRGPVTHDESPSVVRNALDLAGPLPELGMEPGPLLEQTAPLLFDHSLFNQRAVCRLHISCLNRRRTCRSRDQGVIAS